MSSLNAKTIAQASLVLVIVLGTGFLIFKSVNQPVETVYVPEQIKDKLSDELIEILSTTSVFQEVDVIVGCTGPRYLERAEEVIGNFTVLDDWDSFQLFHAMLLPPQIVELASQSFVWRIDYNSEGSIILGSRELTSAGTLCSYQFAPPSGVYITGISVPTIHPLSSSMN